MFRFAFSEECSVSSRMTIQFGSKGHQIYHGILFYDTKTHLYRYYFQGRIIYTWCPVANTAGFFIDASGFGNRLSGSRRWVSFFSLLSSAPLCALRDGYKRIFVDLRSAADLHVGFQLATYSHEVVHSSTICICCDLSPRSRVSTTNTKMSPMIASSCHVLTHVKNMSHHKSHICGLCCNREMRHEEMAIKQRGYNFLSLYL